jgi:hypothetical protein
MNIIGSSFRLLKSPFLLVKLVKSPFLCTQPSVSHIPIFFKWQASLEVLSLDSSWEPQMPWQQLLGAEAASKTHGDYVC